MHISINLKTENMKISARQIEVGMKIQISQINNMTEYYTNVINGVLGYGEHTDEEKNNLKTQINNGEVLKVAYGSIKNDSPIVTILDIKSGDSNGCYHNSKLYVTNEIWLVTDMGTMEISTRQKVNLIN